MKARRVAGYTSARAAATVLGAKPATYAAHENGSRSFSIDDAIRYATLFNVSPGWILTGEHLGGGEYDKVNDTSLDEPILTSNLQSGDQPLTEREIYEFGKHALELLRRAPQTINPSPVANDDAIVIGEVVIQLLLDSEYDPDSEQWEIVAQWKFPSDYMSNILRVDSSDMAILAMPHDNMSPTYEIGDRLIIDFGQKEITVDGVYIFKDQQETMHIQRIEREIKGGANIIVTNDNSAESEHHLSRNIIEVDIEIVGRVCGVIAVR